MAVDEEAIQERLREIQDPELGLDIVTLGLVYNIAISERTVTVDMTLTTPGCPLTGYFTREVERAVLAVPEIEDARVNFVMDPPWTPDRIEEDARLQLGV
jgi:metal-sulfur cluster biosynthetic enzyme